LAKVALHWANWVGMGGGGGWATSEVWSNSGDFHAETNENQRNAREEPVTRPRVATAIGHFIASPVGSIHKMEKKSSIATTRLELRILAAQAKPKTKMAKKPINLSFKRYMCPLCLW